MHARLALLVCLASFSIPGTVLAHHSSAAEFDENKLVKLSGLVTRVEWTNPHAWFYIDVKGEDGTVTNWGVEMGSPTGLVRQGWKRDSMKIGDAVTVEGTGAHDDNIHRANAKNIVLTSTGERLLSGPRGEAQTPR